MTGSAAAVPAISIVTTAYNEVGNVDAFLAGCEKAVAELGVTAEIMFCDDGSTDGTGDRVRAYVPTYPGLEIRLVRHATKSGIAAAFQESFGTVRGDLVFYLPADLESLPQDDVPILYRAMDEKTDFVAGWRRDRGDGKVLASWIYNQVNAWMFDLRLHDANWIKCVRRDKLVGLRMRPGWHRFFAAILARQGARVKEVRTQWHPRRHGKSSFGFERFLTSAADFAAVKIFVAYADRPMLPFVQSALVIFPAALLALVVAVLVPHDAEGARLAAWVLFAVLAAVGAGALMVGCAVELLITQMQARSTAPQTLIEGDGTR